MDIQERIDRFLEGTPFAVAGASTDRAKYGNKVLRCYQQAGRVVFPLNPREEEVEGERAYASLDDLPEVPHGLSIVTPPPISLALLEDAARLGIEHVWLQPGAEDAAVLERGRELGLELIAGGPCLLVELGFPT